MKLAGFLLLPSGWVIVIAAIALLSTAGSRAAFVLSGLAVEVLGLALVIRAHRAASAERG